MSHIVEQPDHGTPIGFIEGDPEKPVFASDRMQLYSDAIAQKMNDNLLGGLLVLETYDLADLPTGAGEGNVVYVNDLSGQRAPVYFDNTDWRRFSDNTVAS